MIINHTYKFIFLKTRKTAGTSLEIALSQFCTAADVITPIRWQDERIRRQLGYPGPRNFRAPLADYQFADWLRLLYRGPKRKFNTHFSAAEIKAVVDPKIWSNYYKFCFERNPFDKAISRYYWNTREPRPPIDAYLQTVPEILLSNWEIYTIADEIVVDFVGRYERLSDDLALIQATLGLPAPLNLPRAKGGYRKNRDHYSRVLNAAARQRIETVCAKEIAQFGYQWQAL
ncbi:hypothetical protein RYO59_001043 [Thermosynechococcaceae cyanobacterium Okahandja]